MHKVANASLNYLSKIIKFWLVIINMMENRFVLQDKIML